MQKSSWQVCDVERFCRCELVELPASSHLQVKFINIGKIPVDFNHILCSSGDVNSSRAYHSSHLRPRPLPQASLFQSYGTASRFWNFKNKRLRRELPVRRVITRCAAGGPPLRAAGSAGCRPTLLPDPLCLAAVFALLLFAPPQFAEEIARLRASRPYPDVIFAVWVFLASELPR